MIEKLFPPLPVELVRVFAVTSFAFGAVLASFLNVVIWRVPRGESIVMPPSHCPKCGASIRWWQNVPIVSWLALRGRCASCRAPISPRYVIVETIGGVLFLAAFWRFGFLAPLSWVWISLMIVGSFVDFDHKLLPDFVTIGGMGYGTAVAAAFSIVRGSWIPLVTSVAGCALGFGLLWIIRFFGSKAFGREAMGMGDVLLMGAIGALYGPVAVLFCLIGSSLLGSVVGLGLVALSKARIGGFVEIPFGPYICIACLAWMLYGSEIVRWYIAVLS